MSQKELLKRIHDLVKDMINQYSPKISDPNLGREDQMYYRGRTASLRDIENFIIDEERKLK